jgi:hypothetical protein
MRVEAAAGNLILESKQSRIIPPGRRAAANGSFPAFTEGENLLPTEKGLVVYNCVKNMKIADAELSAGWERMLADVACGKQEPDTFLMAFKIFPRQVTEEILALASCKR